MNIYVAHRGAPEPGVQSAWVDRRYFSNLAGVNADVVELRQFDCRQGRTQRWSERVTADAGTANQQLLEMVCGGLER